MDKTRETDEWLMQEVAAGRREHLAPLVRRYSSPLLTYLRRMTGDEHRSEELFQEVFVAVWTKRRQYQYPRPFRRWLYAIATNRCRAEFRRAPAQRQSLQDVAEPLQPGNSPFQAAVSTETAEAVAQGVAQLPDQQRTALVLRVWGGLAYAEIAEIMGRSEPTVRSHMHHALAGMRRFLTPRMD